jgi:hypothetical protein
VTRKFSEARQIHVGSVLIQRRSVIDDWSKIDVEWILIENARATSYRIRH